MDNKKWNVASVALQIVTIALVAVLALSGGKTAQNIFTPQAAGYPGVYLEGGNKLVIQSGAKFYVTPGATVVNGAAGTYEGIQSFTNHVVVTGPTAATTATPAAIVNNTGAGNVSLAVRTNATPGVSVLRDGSLLLYAFERYNCLYVEEVANTNENFTPAASCYVVDVATSVNADYTLQTTGMVTGTLLTVYQRAAGTLVFTDTNQLSSDGNAISLGANDAAMWMFDGTKWMQLLKLAGS